MCVQYKWECWQMVLQLQYICKVAQSVVDQHTSFTVSAVWKAVLAVLCLSWADVINSHLKAVFDCVRLDSYVIFFVVL